MSTYTLILLGALIVLPLVGMVLLTANLLSRRETRRLLSRFDEHGRPKPKGDRK